MYSEKEKLALHIGGETTSRIMTLDGKTADDVLAERNTRKFNEQVDQYVEKLNSHAESLDKSAESLADRINTIEILPLSTYVLVKEFKENPFQRIVRSDSGIILDLGGQKPQYKNTDNGEIEEEENFIKVGVVQAIGPECKYLIEGDVIFYSKNSSIPVPFYKQGLLQVNETRVLAVVNDSLTERFAHGKN